MTRKNARGSHNGDTARNAAVIWTVTATARMAGLNELAYLTACLGECGRNGGKPLSGPGAGTVPALERQPRRPPNLGTAPARRVKPLTGNAATGVATANRHAGYQYARSQDFRVLTAGQHRYDLLIRRSVQRVQPVRVHPFPQVRVYQVSNADALVRCCLPSL